MNELWALVEKRSVIFIALEDEVFPVPSPKAAPKFSAIPPIRNDGESARSLQRSKRASM